MLNLTGSNVALGTLETVVPVHDVVAEVDLSVAGRNADQSSERRKLELGTEHWVTESPELRTEH